MKMLLFAIMAVPTFAFAQSLSLSSLGISAPAGISVYVQDSDSSSPRAPNGEKEACARQLGEVVNRALEDQSFVRKLRAQNISEIDIGFDGMSSGAYASSFSLKIQGGFKNWGDSTSCSLPTVYDIQGAVTQSEELATSQDPRFSENLQKPASPSHSWSCEEQPVVTSAGLAD